MAYEVIDSSGTDDDNPRTQYNRFPVGNGVVGNGRSFISSIPYQRMQIDMEFEIHNLEQLAYGAILRAFKAQSDALTWEKEGLITELRKELRVSDDEHRELLSEVNSDDLIRRIREWREAGGRRNVATNAQPHVNNQPSPRVSASRKKQRISLPGNPFGAPFQLINPPLSTADTAHPLPSTVRWGPTPGIGDRKLNSGHVSSGVSMNDPSESLHDLIGRRVMIRWPADNNFYEAVITDYNPENGHHSLVYDSNTPNASMEWVNIKEVPHEDIRWVGDNPVISHPGEPGVPKPGRVTAPSVNQYSNEILPSGNGVMNEDTGDIELFHTDILIKKVEKVLDASHPDALEIDKAKKMLKEHEQALVQVIAKLTDACESASDEEQPFVSGQSIGRLQEIDPGPKH